MFESIYNYIKCKLIKNITTRANLQLKTFIKNNYSDKYYLTQ